MMEPRPPPPTYAPSMRLWVVAAVVVVVLAGCSSSGSGSTQTQVDDATVEQKLASLDSGKFESEGSELTARFRQLLGWLEPKCTEDRERIGDYAVKSQELLDKNAGKTVSLEYVLHQVNASIPDGTSAKPCADAFSSWVSNEEG